MGYVVRENQPGRRGFRLTVPVSALPSCGQFELTVMEQTPSDCTVFSTVFFCVNTAASSRAVPDAASLYSVHTHYDVHGGRLNVCVPVRRTVFFKKIGTSNWKRDTTQSNL